MADATFRSGGLASGMDTNTIIDQLVSLESRPITLIQAQQTAFKSQISQIGSITSALSALKAAAEGLSTSGVLAAKVASSNSAFTATPGTGAQEGRYSLRVDSLAQAAKWMTGGYDSATSPLAAGTLTLAVKGTNYDFDTTGMSLADLSYAIRTSGAPVSATILNGWDAANNKAVSYLSITARDTGYTPGSPAEALNLTFKDPVTGLPPVGGDLGLTQKQAATNAAFNVDGIDFSRSSNTVTDAITGVTLSLTKGAAAAGGQGTAEDLVLQADASATQSKLQNFVDAYNGAMKLVQGALAVTKDTNRNTTLAGDSAVRGLQGRLQSIITNKVSGLANVTTLADIGVKTARDGSLSIDSTTLTAAIGRDPAAIDALFSTASTGIADYVGTLVDQQTRAGDGILTSRQSGLNDRIKQMDDQVAKMQLRIDAYRTNLIKQFTAMESTVSGLKATGNFLTAQNAKSTS